MKQLVKKLINNILLRFGYIFPDKMYLTLLYKIRMGKYINWKNPESYTEKLQILKIYNRKAEYVQMVDKVLAKEYVANIIGNEYIIPTIGVYDGIDDINFDKLPEQFVIKCNHNSGLGLYICKDKRTMDINEVKHNLKKGLKQNYYKLWREWPYKDVERKIIVEKYLKDDNPKTEENCLVDYKFFCFNGEPFMMYVSNDNSSRATTDFFDMNYNRIPIRMKDPNSICLPPKPFKFEEMKNLARKLSSNCPHVRVDFYLVNNHIYFGELTFFHNSGLVPIIPSEWDIKLGQMINF